MYAQLIDSTTAFGPAPSPLGQANTSTTVTLTTPPFVRIPLLPHRRAKETNTAKVEELRDAVQERDHAADQKLAQRIVALRDVISRLKELHSDAQLAGDLESPDSATDLYFFLVRQEVTRRPSIFLLDNGNFQAVWHNNQTNEQISLQFFGHKLIQYAMFARKAGDMDRIAGRGDFDTIRALLKTHGCGHLIV